MWCSASSPSISSRWRYNRSVVRRGRRPITREDAYAPQAATSLVPRAGVVLGILAEHKVRVGAITEALSGGDAGQSHARTRMLPKPPHRSFLTRVWCSASSPSISSRWRYNRSVVRRGRRPITREDAYAPKPPHRSFLARVWCSASSPSTKFALALCRGVGRIRANVSWIPITRITFFTVKAASVNLLILFVSQKAGPLVACFAL